ncbi:MAG TPA: NAD(P)-dependent oxidoreductase [Gallionellaceae bacterium]
MAARGRDSFSPAQLDALEGAGRLEVHTVTQRLSAEEMLALCRPAQIIGFTRRATLDFNSTVIDQLPGLRGVAVYATGYDWLDTDELERRSIRLALLPDYSTQSVAEHTLCLMLSMSRRLHLSDRVARNELPRSVSLRGFELCGKTLGIIGLGNIGRAVARLSQAFGMRILASDVAPQQPVPGVEMVAQARLLSQSDIVVLACNLWRGSGSVMGPAELTAMKPGALLINPARSALVNNDAVVQAIRQKHLRGYAVDDTAFCQAQLELVEHGRILQSAHTAWYSDEAMARGTQAWVDALVGLAHDIQNERSASSVREHAAACSLSDA